MVVQLPISLIILASGLRVHNHFIIPNGPDYASLAEMLANRFKLWQRVGIVRLLKRSVSRVHFLLTCQNSTFSVRLPFLYTTINGRSSPARNTEPVTHNKSSGAAFERAVINASRAIG